MFQILAAGPVFGPDGFYTRLRRRFADCPGFSAETVRRLGYKAENICKTDKGDES